MNNQQELQFVRYIFDRVKGEITGRDLNEVVNSSPRELFHAGVLLPREMELASIDSQENLFSSSNKDEETSQKLLPKIDSESAMGLDFQVRLPKDVEVLDLIIRASFDIYYPVFPTHSEVLEKMNEGSSNESSEETENLNESESVDPELLKTSPDEDLLESASASNSIASQIASLVTSELAESKIISDDLLILPVKFRKRRLNIPEIYLQLNPRNLLPPLEIREQFNSALMEASINIAQDKDVWRHLGTPSEAKRELKGVGIRASEKRYNDVLSDTAKGDLAIPPWSAYLTVSGEEALSINENKNPNKIFRLNITLANGTPAFDRSERLRGQIEENALFDCHFSVEVTNGTIVPFEFQGAAKDYRYDRNFDGIGNNCVAIRTRNENSQIISTESVPLFEQPWYRTREDIPVFFEDLDDSSTANPLGRLEVISSQMKSHLEQWNAFLNIEAKEKLNDSQIEICIRDRDNFAGEIERFKLGVECLKRDAQLLRAFRLMNRVFRENGAKRNIRSWRLFQLAFMVIQLPALAVRELDLSQSDSYTQSLKSLLNSVDVLWFPTGGGKTEAYLGLITTGLFFDRLRGKTRGLSAWMRFPLRMLSLQQLERLAKVIAKAEMIRASEPDLNTGAGDPFSIGYFVGSGNTPNRIRESNLSHGQSNNIEWERQQVLRYCPFCDSQLTIKFKRDSWRLVHTCQNNDCYTNTSSALGFMRGSIPVFIVDNEVYRYRTSVLVGTVDKLAVLGFQKHFAHLITPVTQQCPQHGYLSFGQCIENIGGGPCIASAKTFINLQAEKDPIPSLLIQDELHLLKEELGTFNSHYEGFLDYISKLQGFLPPKVLAATATIEAYETQTFHLYLKNANRFPLPSWNEGESMYATSQPLEQKRRLYVGLLTHRRSPESAVLRTLEVYHRIIEELKANPQQAITEIKLEGVSKEIFQDYLRLYDLSLTYVNRKATGGNIAYGLNQSVSPKLSSPITTQLLTGDNTMTEVGRAIERIEKERDDLGDTRLNSLIATSLISHGVDLERINFMCMAGMPSKFAEYIQASSRAARNHVGLVVVCFKRSDMRERSQYHYFLPNHRYLDRLVEPVPINRFSAFAAERTVPGLIAGLLLSYYSRTLYSQNRISKSLDNMRQLRKAIESGEITIDQLRKDIETIIGAQDSRISEMQQRYLVSEISSAVQNNWDQINRSLDPNLGDAISPMTSFRDVDETIDFIANDASSIYVEKIRSSD